MTEQQTTPPATAMRSGVTAQTGVLTDVLLGKPDHFRWVAAGHFEDGDFCIPKPGVALLGWSGDRSTKEGAEQVAGWLRASDLGGLQASRAKTPQIRGKNPSRHPIGPLDDGVFCLSVASRARFRRA